MSTKPSLFIGSSVEGRAIAYAIQQNLSYDAEVTVWDQGVFDLSGVTIESLMHCVESSDFGIFVFSPDDITKTRGTTKSVARDNVIFELGLFIGKLGRKRTFIIIPEKSKLSIPTDLLGITLGKYENTRNDSNLKAGTGAFCHQVRMVISELGKLSGHEYHEEPVIIQEKSVTEGQNIKKEDEEETDWIVLYIDKKYDLAIEKIGQNIDKSEDPKEKKGLQIYKMFCEAKIDLKKSLESLKSFMDVNNDDPFVYQRIVWTYNVIGQPKLAKVLADEGLSKFTENSELTLLHAEILANEGQIIDSISLLRANADKDEKIALQLCEYLEEELEDKVQALLVIHKAYLQDTSSENIKYKFASLARDNGHDELALFLFASLKNSFPDNHTYITYYANACLALNFNDLAIQNYRKANELAKEKAGWILSNIGNILKNQGFYEDAKEYFLKTIALKHDSVYVYNRLADLSKTQEEEKKRFDKLHKKGRIEALTPPNPPIEDVNSEKVEQLKLVLPPILLSPKTD